MTPGKAATYPDHIFDDSAGGHCILFYQLCQVVESGRWVGGGGVEWSGVGWGGVEWE